MLLVDTYNVLHVTGILPPEIAGPDAIALARLISQSRYRAEETWLICDGLRRRGIPNERFEHIRLVYAGSQHEAADAKIEQILETRRGASVLVVSNDRRVQRAARRACAKWITSDRFLETLAVDIRSGIVAPERNLLRDSIPLASASVTRWMQLFGLDEDGIHGLMDSLGIEEPDEQPADATPEPHPETHPTKNRQRNRAPPPDDPPPAPPTKPDPTLDNLLRGTPVDPADLDMRKWLDGPDRRSP